MTLNRKFAYILFAIAVFTFSLTFISQSTRPSLKVQKKPQKAYAKRNILGNKQVDTNINYKVPAHAVLLYTKTNNVCKKAYPYIAYVQDDSFNPLTASNEELKAHGYPTRPENKEDLEIWKGAVSVKLITPVLVPTSESGGHSIILNSDANNGHKTSDKLK